jgi:hypothetical protein
MTKADDAFSRWWAERHDWDFTGEGEYEKRFREAFEAGRSSMSVEMDHVIKTKIALRRRVDALEKNGVTFAQAAVEGTLRQVLAMLEGKT